MKILIKTKKDFPFDWVDTDFYRNSNAFRKEIYLREHKFISGNLISLFFTLFDETKDSLFVYNESWWDFCLDTWDIINEKYNYSLENKSEETKKYLQHLIDSDIEPGYSGCCICKNWNSFLQIILKCLLSHKAPYSPLFFDPKNDYFFYYHESGSIGIYYKKQSEVIHEILSKASDKYIIKE